MASWIDDVTPHNPVRNLKLAVLYEHWHSSCNVLEMQHMQVWLSRMDRHMGLANSVALKIAAITNYTQDPDGGGVVRTTDGGNFPRVHVFEG